jgi:hypothetical protein
MEPDYAVIFGRLTVDQPPITNLTVTLQIGDESFNVIIPSAKSIAGPIVAGPYENWFALRTDLSQPFFCIDKVLGPINWFGGRFAEVNLPEAEIVSICPYVGTITASGVQIEQEDPDYEPEEDEYVPLVIRGEFSVDNLPVGTTLEIALALGNPFYRYNIRTESWDWTGGRNRPEEPRTYIIEIPGILSRFVGDWEWEVFDRRWIYKGLSYDWRWDGSEWQYVGPEIPDFSWDSTAGIWVYEGEQSLPPRPPNKRPPAEQPPEDPEDPAPVEIELAVPRSYDPDFDRLSIPFARQGGFSSHVVPDLGGDDLPATGAFLIAIEWAEGGANGDAFQFRLENDLLNGTADFRQANTHIFVWDLDEQQVEAVKTQLAQEFPLGDPQFISEFTFGPINAQTTEIPDPFRIYPGASELKGGDENTSPGELLFEFISVAGTIFTSDTWIYTGFVVGDRIILDSNDRYVWNSNEGGISIVFFPDTTEEPE